MMRIVIILLISLNFVYPALAQTCNAPEQVCAWKDRIVGIKTPNMIASGIILSDGFILTNRHVAEDHLKLLIRNKAGSIIPAQPLAHAMPADLALLRLEGGKGLPVTPHTFSDGQPSQLYVVAFDQGRNGPRVYQPGEFAHYPDTKRYPQARIHSDVRALPGNSGGAVVDAKGRWVGVLASGGSGISEIIPAIHTQQVIDTVDEAHRQSYLETGRLIRICADTLYAASRIDRDPPQPIIDKIERNCMGANNKQLLDEAGQMFGRWWLFERSENFLRQSERLDPNSPNMLMSLAVTYHLGRESEKELPILKRYLALVPDNAQALRLGVQVAGMLKDREFADEVLLLMKIHNPASLPLAQDFIDKAFAD